MTYLVRTAWIVSVCIALSAPGAARADVVVKTAAQLAAAVEKANQGGDRTIVLKDGLYTLDQGLWIEAKGVTIRGASGNRDKVIIEGRGMKGPVTHVMWVLGSNFTLRDVTVRKVANHCVQVHGDQNADNFRMINVRLQDAYEQLLKVSYDPKRPKTGSDKGLVEGCLFEYTAGKGPQYYIGGVDAHAARGWIIRRNIFRYISSPSDSVAEHAVHFWSDSRDTVVEQNRIVNCDRGIGFGMGERGHKGGIIRHNMIFHDRSGRYADVGIALESSPGTKVYNNTVYQEHGYPNAIEYRFPSTKGVEIFNNLTNRSITARDGASGKASHNITGAKSSWFVKPSKGDLHLKKAVGEVVNKGRKLPKGEIDFDGRKRPMGGGVDVGAHEMK